MPKIQKSYEKQEKTLHLQGFCSGDPDENRTRVTAVKGLQKSLYLLAV